jgi:hypothetical protein
MCACMNLCMYIYICACMNTCMCVCMCVYMNTCMCVCMCVNVSVCVYESMYAPMYVCMYMCMNLCTHVCIYVCMYVCMHVRVHEFMCVHTCVFICNIYVCTWAVYYVCILLIQFIIRRNNLPVQAGKSSSYVHTEWITKIPPIWTHLLPVNRLYLSHGLCPATSSFPTGHP